ncbi:hypothetical protein LTR27_012258 [Elasticomyces elasticus]|nr:hypothetical protein LTR27_012258 [Elasticomyces elasticus]
MTAFTEFLRLFIGLSPSTEPTPDADHFLGALRPRRALKNPARLPNTPTLSLRPALKKVQKRTSKPKAFKCPNCKARITLTANGHPSKRSPQRTVSSKIPRSEIAAFWELETWEECTKRLAEFNRVASGLRPRSTRRTTRPEMFVDLAFPKHVPAAPKRKAIKKKQTTRKQQTAKKQQTVTEQQASPTFSSEYPPNAIFRRWKDGTTIVTDPQGNFESLGCGPSLPVTPTDEWLPYSEE